jgi:hypothetical protein
LVNVVEERSNAGVRAGFLQFAETVFSDTPVCRALSLGVAENEELLSLAAKTQVGQYPPYVLFAAVHYLLIADATEPLAAYFPTLRRTPLAPDGVFPAFAEFCSRREKEISDLVSTRLVQTNEVGRSACLAPAFAYVSRLARSAPLHLIDIGAAAGLNLLFDRYLLDYGRFVWGQSSSRVRIPCELGDSTDPPLQGWQPNTSHRVGVDINPIDVTSEDDVRWLQALVWPDRPERAEVLGQAIQVATEEPPTILDGDAVTLIDGLLAEVPLGERPCVYYSYALEYFPEHSRTEFRQKLADYGARRDLYFIEMSGIGERASVRASLWRAGHREDVTLAQCQPHGGWMKWLSN